MFHVVDVIQLERRLEEEASAGRKRELEREGEDKIYEKFHSDFKKIVDDAKDELDSALGGVCRGSEFQTNSSLRKLETKIQDARKVVKRMREMSCTISEQREKSRRLAKDEAKK